jgi:hypothetical protein
MLAADKQAQENAAMSTIASGCTDLGLPRPGPRATPLTTALKIAVIKTSFAGALMLTSGLAASAREPTAPRPPQRWTSMAPVMPGLPWQAPIGRQPRAKDLIDAVDPSSADEDERMIDRAIDHKLLICRDC